MKGEIMRLCWRVTLPAALLVLAAAVGIFLGAPGSRTGPEFRHGAVLDPPRPLPDVALVGPGGARVRLSDYRGRWLWVFFGYTHCPDVCPTALGEMAREYKTLGAEATRPQVVLISVDPQRDTPARLSEYVGYFHPRFVGLTGSAAAIDELARASFARYRKHAAGSEAGYLVEHTAYVHAVDPEGRLRVLYPPGTKPGDLAGDFAFLRRSRSQ